MDTYSEEVCSSFKCPENYSPVDYPDTVVCEDTGCTKDLCCDKTGAISTEPMACST